MTAPAPAALAGRTVVVTRAGGQAGELADRLGALGAEVVVVPTIEVVDPSDGGAGLRAAAARAEGYDWVVVTSPNGAERLASALPPGVAPRVAVVGPGTAAAARRAGLRVGLVPQRAIGEGLAEDAPSGDGRVLVAQAAAARTVVAEGWRAKGWQVDVVEAYATVPAPVAPGVAAAVARADAVTFTSASTVRAFVAAGGPAALPRCVVCIGPQTAAAAEAEGVAVTAVADPHTLDGLVEAVVRVLGGGS